MKSLNRSYSSSFETDIVSEVLEKKRSTKHVSRVAIIAFITACFAYELYGQLVTKWLLLDYDIVWWTECIATIVTAFNLLWECILLAYQRLFPSYIDVTLKEKVLLGVRDGEPGFRLSPVKQQQRSPSSLTYTHSPSLPSKLASRSFSSTTYLPSSQPSPSSNTIDDFSHSSSMYTLTQNKSYANATLGGYDDGSYIVKTRISPGRSPVGGDENIASFNSLDAFLREEAAKERTEHLMQGETTANHAFSFWNVNRSVMDYVPLLRKFQYQVAPRTTPNTKTSQLDDDTEGANYAPDEVWTKRNVSLVGVDLWMENLRYWLGQSVVQRLANEIQKVNAELRKVGSEDSQIGDVNVSTLKNLAFTKGKFVPTLNNIISYLEVTSNQEYLVQRIRRLGNDGCIADFDWNGGSSYSGKPWEDHLPTDAAIIMHLFCSYMDARLPANPKYPDGKSFTCQHFMATPEKPNFDHKKDYLCIYQTKINPPHYKVIIGEEIHEIVKGRCNLFQAILLFLYHIKEKEHGMLGHVNLGLSGINILWVLTQKYR